MYRLNKGFIQILLWGIVCLLFSCGNEPEDIYRGDSGSSTPSTVTPSLTEEDIMRIIDKSVNVEAKYTSKNYVYLMSCNLNSSIGNQLSGKTVLYGMEYGLMEDNAFYVEFDHWTGNDSQLAVSIVVPESTEESLTEMAVDYSMYYTSYTKITDKLKSGQKLLQEEQSLYTNCKNLMADTEVKAKKYFKARNYVSVNNKRYYFSTIEIVNNQAVTRKVSCYTDEKTTTTSTCEWCDGDGRCDATHCDNGLCTKCKGVGYTYMYVPGLGNVKDACVYCNSGKCPSCHGTMKCSRCSGKGTVTYTSGGSATKKGEVVSLDDIEQGGNGNNEQGPNDEDPSLENDDNSQGTVDISKDGENKIFTVAGVSFTMIAVKAGTFQMGSTTGDNDEKPVHSVTISKDYYIGETEVTQALWKAVTGYSPTASGSSWSSSSDVGDNYPAYYISYEDVQSFITKLNQMTGQKFRMPTEAEWEYAAKGGNKSKGYTYSGSNTIGDVAWYGDNSGSKTHPVKTKAPNELGIYDMSGNVWEWCSDWYGFYSSNAVTDPTGATSGSFRVYRGGGWCNYATVCRSANRDLTTPTACSGFIGFRLAL